MAVEAVARPHLVLLAGQALQCDSCKAGASVLLRCPKCERVVARCGAHPESWERLQRDGCGSWRDVPW